MTPPGSNRAGSGTEEISPYEQYNVAQRRTQDNRARPVKSGRVHYITAKMGAGPPPPFSVPEPGTEQVQTLAHSLELLLLLLLAVEVEHRFDVLAA